MLGHQEIQKQKEDIIQIQQEQNQSIFANKNQDLLIPQEQENKNADNIDISNMDVKILAKLAEQADSVFGSVSKNRSGAATDLMENLQEWKEMTPESFAELSASEKIEKLFMLSQTSKNYRYSHSKKHHFFKFHWTYDGSIRYDTAKRVQEKTSDVVMWMLTEEDRESIYKNDDADTMVGESPKVIEKQLKRAAEAYYKYSAQLGNSCLGYLPGREIFEKKLRALKANERLIKLYRREHEDVEKRNPDIAAYIREYEECLAWEKLLNQTGYKEESLDEMIDDHLEEEGEIEKVKEKDKIEPLDDKEDLSIEQRAGIEEIDNWMLRNFEKGINQDGPMVDSLLSMSKRERLHIYYLVEYERRRESNVSDVWLSQSYTPNLKSFKKKVLANKAMFWKRISGDYVYSFKISEAMQISKSYRKDIKEVAQIAADQKQQVKNVEAPKKIEGLSDSENERIQKLTSFRANLEAFRDSLIRLQNATTEHEKMKAKIRVNEYRETCKGLSIELRDYYQKIKKDDTHVAEADTKEAKFQEGTDFISLIASLPNTFDQDFAGGTPMVFIAAIGGVIGAVTGTITMVKNWSGYTNLERTERTLSLTSSIVNATAGAIGIGAMIASTSVSMLTTAATTITVAPVVGVVLSAGVGIVQAATAGKMEYHGKKAGDFFKEKRKNAELQKYLNPEKSKDKELQRELKYEKNMQQLQKDLQKRQEEKYIFTGIGLGISVGSIFCPPLAIAALVVGIVGGIRDFARVENLKTALFDRFFNMDKITEKVAKMRYKDSKLLKDNPPIEKIKESLRLRIAARAGFNSMKTAAVFICSKFARLIRKKLFDPGTSDMEREGYIEFVKSLNVRYNEKKQLPDENVLVRKMIAK